MAEVAREEGVAPTDLSFTVALHYLRYEWHWLASSSAGSLPKHLQRLRQRLGDLLVSKQRRGRQCPRVVKKPPARYPFTQVRYKGFPLKVKRISSRDASRSDGSRNAFLN